MKSLERPQRKPINYHQTSGVDGIFHGDIAKLDDSEMAHSYGAYVMVDEARHRRHRANGRGTPEHFGIEGKVDIVAGTFSKDWAR